MCLIYVCITVVMFRLLMRVHMEWYFNKLFTYKRAMHTHKQTLNQFTLGYCEPLK